MTEDLRELRRTADDLKEDSKRVKRYLMRRKEKNDGVKQGALTAKALKLIHTDREEMDLGRKGLPNTSKVL